MMSAPSQLGVPRTGVREPIIRLLLLRPSQAAAWDILIWPQPDQQLWPLVNASSLTDAMPGQPNHPYLACRVW
jgi:hypothetical protein